MVNNKRKATTVRKRGKKRQRTGSATSEIYRTTDLKVNTLSINPLGVTTAGYLIEMYPGTRGTNSVNEFVGNRLTLANFTMRWAYTWADSYNKIRVSVFQLLGGGTPTIANFYQSVNYADSPIMSNPTLPFKTLYDWYGTVHSEEPTFAVGTVKGEKCYVPGRKMGPQIFPPGVFTRPTSGNIVICALSDSIAPPNPNFSFYAQTKFTDS